MALTNEIAETEVVSDHALTISGLDTGSAYLFEVGSNDPVGNGETVSGQQGFTTTAEADVAAPVITGDPVVQTVTDTRATIRWATDEISDSQVDVLEHGRLVDERVTARTTDLVREHGVTVTNLKPSTFYDFMASSVDRNGNGPTLKLGGFNTAAVPDLSPPVVLEGPAVVGKDDISARIVWRTNEPADTYVDYGATRAYGLMVQDSKRDTIHVITITGLEAGTTYYFRVQSADMAGNQYVQAQPGSFVTDAQPDQTPPVTPENFTVIAGDGATYLSWSPNAESDLGGYVIERSTDDASLYLP